MDPDATLRDIRIALDTGDILEASALRDALALWLVKGGFHPDWGREPLAAHYYGVDIPHRDND